MHRHNVFEGLANEYLFCMNLIAMVGGTILLVRLSISYLLS